MLGLDAPRPARDNADRQQLIKICALQLVGEVSLGRAGIVLGLECSRLARDNADWQQLIKICALNGTLILYEDGLYDPADPNDRLLLGVKGQLSEFELHYLQARMRGGLLAKAARGELALRLPIGLCYDAAGDAALDPDSGSAPRSPGCSPRSTPPGRPAGWSGHSPPTS